MRKLNTVLLIAGLVFLAWLVWRINPAQLWRELRTLGWGLLPFVLGEGIAEMIHTLGWRRCLSAPYRSLPWLAKRARRNKALRTASLHVTRVDEALRTFYREHPRDLWLAASWHMLGFL